MGWYDKIQRARADVSITPVDPLSPFWYNPAGASTGTFAGFPVGPDTATRVSAVFACVSLKAETVGGLPLHLYRRINDDERERAKDHRLYKTVRREPNARHSPMEFFSSVETRINLRGASLNWIQDNGRDVHLIPIPPRDVLKVELLDTGRYRFDFRDPQTGKTRTIGQDEAFYVPDLMEDGFNAYARAALAREAIAVAAAMEGAVGGFFRNNMAGRVMFSNTTMADEKKRKEFREMLRENYAGWKNASEAMVLWGGMTATELGKIDEAALFTDPRKNQVAEVARYFGRIPLFMIGLEEKSTTWGTGIEQQTQAWINYGMMPSLIRIEQAANRDLLHDDEREEFFFEFNLDGILRGDSKQRAEVNEIRKRNGALSANEWRVQDNMRKRTDPGGDEYQDSTPGAAANAELKRPEPKDDEDEEIEARIVPQPLMADAVNRIAGREIGDLAARAGRSSDPAKFEAWVLSYYAEHREYVIKVLTPTAQAFGFDAWVVEECAKRVCLTAEQALSSVSDAPKAVALFTATRREVVSTVLDETFRAGSAVRRAA